MLAALACVLLTSACASTSEPVVKEGPDGRPFVNMGDVDQKPELVGGMASLRERVQYPEAARSAGVQGTVYLSFFVEEDGTTSGYEVLRSPHPALTQETIRVARATRFEPGRHDGAPMRVKLTLPMRFAFTGEK